MVQGNDRQKFGELRGVSLSSFLQMLEHERKSCTIIVKSGDNVGEIHFDDGLLIDASCNNKVGVEAAYILLSWGDPSFLVGAPTDQLRRIDTPLAQILLEAAALQDEQDAERGGNEVKVEAANTDTAKDNTGVGNLVKTIVSIAGVKHYFIMNRKGVMIAQSSQKRSMGDFIRYCIVSGSRLRKELGVRGPTQIRIMMDNNEKLLVFPGNGIILALLVNENMSIDEATGQLRQILNK